MQLFTEEGMTCGRMSLIVATTRGTVRQWSWSSLSISSEITHAIPDMSAPFLWILIKKRMLLRIERNHFSLAKYKNTCNKYIKFLSFATGQVMINIWSPVGDKLLKLMVVQILVGRLGGNQETDCVTYNIRSANH